TEEAAGQSYAVDRAIGQSAGRETGAGIGVGAATDHLPERDPIGTAPGGGKIESATAVLRRKAVGERPLQRAICRSVGPVEPVIQIKHGGDVFDKRISRWSKPEA